MKALFTAALLILPAETRRSTNAFRRSTLSLLDMAP
jgi:hypothetical protein